MKPFYILLLIVGILIALFGMYLIYDGSSQLIAIRILTEDPAMAAFENERIFYIVGGVCISIIGLLISLFSRGKLKQ